MRKTIAFYLIIFLLVGCSTVNEPVMVTESWLVGKWVPYEWERMYYDTFEGWSGPVKIDMADCQTESIEFMKGSQYQLIYRSGESYSGRYMVSNTDEGQKLTIFNTNDYHGESVFGEWDIELAKYKFLETSNLVPPSVYGVPVKDITRWKKL